MKIGIEIEMVMNAGETQESVARALRDAGINAHAEHYNHTTRDHWKVTTDASIGSRGCEVVSPILYDLQDLETVMDRLATLGTTSRNCGVHVHHDATGANTDFFKRLVKIYAKSEAAIDAFMPKSRRENNNQYCRSIKGNIGLVDFLNRVDRQHSYGALVNLLGTRYRKLNLESFTRYGTVEFRQHSSTLEFEKIQNWIELTATMLERAKSGNVPNTEPSNAFDFAMYNVPRAVKKFFRNRTAHFANA